ncbi:MAG: hypothetical protein AB3N15_06175 [Paracoccaceae bacterium]
MTSAPDAFNGGSADKATVQPENKSIFRLVTRDGVTKVGRMGSTVRFLVLLAASTFGLAVFAYGVAGMLTPFYAGAWPIFLSYVVLFLAALLMPIKAGLNARFFKALTGAALFNFLFLYLAKANMETSREVLFVHGLPTLYGVIFQLTLCVGILMFATGMSSVIRDFSQLLARIGLKK